ncbi:MAG: biotin carboxylase N-terminal domain-containing protein [Bdellovibrionota bacterium]
MPYQPPFQRILIANRGEIAIRIARAATELGIRTIGIYSHEDRFALHRFKTDESYKVGIKGQPLSGYLNVEEIVELAKKIKADAIHPGYGFLSESSEFAEHCSKNGIVFIGPSSEILQAFGDKVAARRTAIEAGLQVVPGTKHPLKDFHEAKEIAQQMGYPVTLKAISGGGGKGIRMIEAESELEHAFQRSSSEAKSNFGKAELYLEKKVISPRHIEVQILGDQSGHIVHLFERDCSIQRRHQKVVEVAPALGLSESTRASIREQAVKLAKHVGYVGIGTIEFLVDKNEVSYFLEVNPRVQVEHTVTEMITSIDLIQASILVAAGCKLADEKIGIKSQECVKVNGAAIQCRITTEDPLNNFAPDTGRIIAYRPAAGFGIRLDGGHGTSGGVVTPYYDSLLVKVTAFAKTYNKQRQKCIAAFLNLELGGETQYSFIKKYCHAPSVFRIKY